MRFSILFLLLVVVLFGACSKDKEEPSRTDLLYFPPTDGDTWETLDANNLGWNSDAIPELLDYLEERNSRAFLILKNGKIVIENYWGSGYNNQPFSQSSNWYWASAGKALTAILVGLAQEDGYLDINDKSTDYLGAGWTSLSSDKEALITIKHQLSMTSGLDDGVMNNDCTDPSCLRYKAEAGMRWAYHNALYTILDRVIEAATHQSFDDFFRNKLKDKIGMNGMWVYNGDNHIYYSTPRSMARFGLLMLNKGKWDAETIINDHLFFQDMIQTSQDLNPSYGYLWWLNGKESFMMPGLQYKFNGYLTPNAPDDMYAAMGKNGQLLNVIPSQNLIIVRMGDIAEDDFVPAAFQDEMWEYINAVIN